MKKLLLSMVVMLFALVTNAQERQAEIKFETTVHDFGTFAEGVQATYEFKFTNVGNAPLVLSGVNPSCGCTAPEWPKDPIMPGQSGKIKVTYNSTGRPNSFNKSITVTSNAKNGTLVLTIKGNVEPKKPEPVSPMQNPNK